MRQALQTAQNPLGLAPRIDTARSAGFAPVASTAVHAPDTTRPRPAKRRRYTPRARRCIVCHGVFTPKNKHAKTCGTACRSKLYRERRARRTPAEKPSPTLIALTCPHCGKGALKTAGVGAKYCSPSCRTMAARSRRSAAVHCLIALGQEDTTAADMLDAAGLRAVSKRLGELGYTYNDQARAFVREVE